MPKAKRLRLGRITGSSLLRRRAGTCKVRGITTDVAPLKEIQKFILSQGDYAALAREGMQAAAELVDASALAAGQTARNRAHAVALALTRGEIVLPTPSD